MMLKPNTLTDYQKVCSGRSTDNLGLHNPNCGPQERYFHPYDATDDLFQEHRGFPVVLYI